MLLAVCLFFLARLSLAAYLAYRFTGWSLTFWWRWREGRLWRRTVCLAAKGMVLTKKSHRKVSLFLSSRDYISAFYPYLRCPVTALKIFTNVLENLRESGVLWHPSTQLEEFDVATL